MPDRRADALRLVAFLNSLHIPDGDDLLTDERAASWLAEWLGDRVEGRPEVTPESMDQLRTLREGLRQLVAATAGTRPDTEAIARAEAVLRATPLVVELADHEWGPGLACPAGSDMVGRAIAAAAAAYLTVRAGDEWSRIKVCAAPDCRWAFLDTSRNRSRRWCAMSDCGNRAKNRGWRERQRTLVK